MPRTRYSSLVGLSAESAGLAAEPEPQPSRVSTDLGGSPSRPTESPTSPTEEDESDEDVKPTAIHSSIEPLDSVDDGAAALEAELERSRLEVQRLLEHEQHLDDASWARR